MPGHPELIHEEVDGQSVYTVIDGGVVRGFVAIDTTVGGRSCGGLRMLADLDREEIRGLARAMTLKFGLLRLPQGGAKAGVIGDPEAPQAERWRTLARFAEGIAPLLRSKRFVPGTDMGTSNSDIRHLLASAGVRVQPRALRGDLSGYYTACSVFAAAKQATRQLGWQPGGWRVAIEGFGSVGRPLAKLFQEVGARVVAISNRDGALHDEAGFDVERLSVLVGQPGRRVLDAYPGAARLSSADLLELPVDILCPCARHHSIHAGNAPRIQARLICAGANNPIEPLAERALLGRGITCLPDFVTNCGGVLGGTMAFASVGRSAISTFIQDFMSDLVAWMLAEAQRQGRSPREVMEPLARRRFEETRRATVAVSLRGRLFAAGLYLYREGVVPGSLVARFSMPFFERQVSGDWSR